MERFEMVAKTFSGLEGVLSEELRSLGAENVQSGVRSVRYVGDKELLYRSNICCRTALRILKPIYRYEARDWDELYEGAKGYDWGQVLMVDSSFAIDTVTTGERFTHSRYATYRVKDAIADWFRDRYDARPRVRVTEADVRINVHINGSEVTISLDSSGESLHKRGWRVAQTDAPINEVLAAGILLQTGWRGDTPLVDPMCGSGTFLVEAALIARNINPGIYRRGFAFEHWQDFDAELFERIYNDDSGERDVDVQIYGADISPRAVSVALANVKSAGVQKYVHVERRGIGQWEYAPQPAGVVVTNPPYGERISAPDMEGLYRSLGSVLKFVFTGYRAWVIGYKDEYFDCLGLAPSRKIPILNGPLECSLREYVLFAGDRKSYVKAGGKIGRGGDAARPVSGQQSAKKTVRLRRGAAAQAHKTQLPVRRPVRRDADTPEHAPVSDNPLALRRNVFALRSIVDRQPKLPPQAGPILRDRKHKKSDNDEK